MSSKYFLKNENLSFVITLIGKRGEGMKGNQMVMKAIKNTDPFITY